MKLLLDSHTLIWAACEPGQLSGRVRAALLAADNTIYFSAVSLWEISLKFAIGKLALEGVTLEQLYHAGRQMGFEALPLSPETAAGCHALPRTAHKDPFDRMLAWQAICGPFTLVSRDTGLNAYAKQGLKVLW